jgi:transposase
MDAAGTELLSRRVQNDEAELVALIDEVLSFSDELVVWATDQPGGSAALFMLALLWERNQRVLYVPGLAVDRAREAYRGESKTDAKDARVIADQARMRPDLSVLTPEEGDLAELQLLLARRRDLVTDQTRTITRLRETLLALFPALERALDLNNKGALSVLSHYQTPTTIRRAGHKRLAAFLKNRGVKGADALARKALRPLPRPRPRASPCPPKASPPPSSPNSLKRRSLSRSAYPPLTGSLSSVFSLVPRLGFSLACLAHGSDPRLRVLGERGRPLGLL